MEEDRAFSHISKNWRGRPLESHEVIVDTIAATTSRTEVTVPSELDTRNYPNGIEITDQQMEGLDGAHCVATTSTAKGTTHSFHNAPTHDPP